MLAKNLIFLMPRQRGIASAGKINSARIVFVLTFKIKFMTSKKEEQQSCNKMSDKQKKQLIIGVFIAEAVGIMFINYLLDQKIKNI